MRVTLKIYFNGNPVDIARLQHYFSKQSSLLSISIWQWFSKNVSFWRVDSCAERTETCLIAVITNETLYSLVLYRQIFQLTSTNSVQYFAYNILRTIFSTSRKSACCCVCTFMSDAILPDCPSAASCSSARNDCRKRSAFTTSIRLWRREPK